MSAFDATLAKLQKHVHEQDIYLSVEAARMDGEASGFRWGFFFGVCIVAALWSLFK